MAAARKPSAHSPGLSSLLDSIPKQGSCWQNIVIHSVPYLLIKPVTTDHAVPCCAVLWLQGKVRAISFDHQAQQVVSLATDETLSWWTPDLQLKGSARLTNAMEAVTVRL